MASIKIRNLDFGSPHFTFIFLPLWQELLLWNFDRFLKSTSFEYSLIWNTFWHSKFIYQFLITFFQNFWLSGFWKWFLHQIKSAFFSPLFSCFWVSVKADNLFDLSNVISCNSYWIICSISSVILPPTSLNFKAISCLFLKLLKSIHCLSACLSDTFNLLETHYMNLNACQVRKSQNFPYLKHPTASSWLVCN